MDLNGPEAKTFVKKHNSTSYLQIWNGIASEANP